MKFLLTAALVMAGSLSLFAGEKVGDDAPDLEGLTILKNGANLDTKLEDGAVEIKFQKDKVYVVELWATWCPPCVKSIPHISKVAAAYKDSGVVVIGISLDKDADVARKFAEKNKDMTYAIAHDTKGEIAKDYLNDFKQKGIPTAFVIGKDGKVAWIGHPMRNLEGAIEAALKK